MLSDTLTVNCDSNQQSKFNNQQPGIALTPNLSSIYNAGGIQFHKLRRVECNARQARCGRAGSRTAKARFPQPAECWPILRIRLPRVLKMLLAPIRKN